MPALRASQHAQVCRFSNSRMRFAVKIDVGLMSGISGVNGFYDHSQRTHVAANCCWTLRRTCSISLDQLADGRVIVAKLERSAPRPASVQNDSMICAAMRFAAAISFVPVLRKISRRTPSTAAGEAHVPIISPGWGRLQIEFPRCAPNRYE